MYSLSTFLKPISGTDTTIQIRTQDLVVKYTISPYTVKTVIVSNNLLKVSLNSNREIVIDFNTKSEAVKAGILIESALEVLREKPPLFIDKIVKEYINDIISGSTGSQGSASMVSYTPSGYLTASNVQEAIDQLEKVTDIRNTIHVKKGDIGPGEFSSIADAVNYITDMSETNRYLIKVNSGIFIEPEINLIGKPYVSIIGSSIHTTIVTTDSTTHSIFNIGENNEISFIGVEGAGPGHAGVRIYDSGDFSQLHRVSFTNCDIGVELTSNSQDTYFYGEHISIRGTHSYGIKVIAENGFKAYASLENLFNAPQGCINPYGVWVSGIGGDIEIQSSIFNSELYNDPSVGTAIYIEDGSSLKMVGSQISGWHTGVQVGNVGTYSYLSLNGCDFRNTYVYDLNIEHPDTDGQMTGYTIYSKTINPISSTFFITGIDPRIITVYKTGGNFTSISEAVNSITDNSSSNRFAIKVGAGLFIEPFIDLSSKPYVSIIGISIQETIIEPDDMSHDVLMIGLFNEISFLTIQNSGIGKAGIKIEDGGYYSQLHKVSFSNVDIGIDISSYTVPTTFYGEYVDFNGVYSIGLRLVANNGIKCYANMENYYNLPIDATDFVAGTWVSGDGSEISILSSGHVGEGYGNGIYMEDGAYVDLSASNIHQFEKAILVGNVGLPPTLNINGSDISNNDVLNLDVEHTGTLGSFVGYSVYDKTYVSATSSFFIGGKDHKLITVSKKGADFTSIKEAIDSIIDSSNTNRYSIQVGPGDYYEDTMTMKPYVSILGNNITTRIFPNTDSQHIFIGSAVSSVENCLVSGAGSGYAAFYFSEPETDPNPIFISDYTQRSFTIKNIIFGSNDTHVICYADYHQTTVQVVDCKYGSSNQFNVGFYATNNNNSIAARILLLHCYSQGMATIKPECFAYASGINCEIVMNSVQSNAGSSPQTGSKFLKLENGANCRLIAVNATGWDYGIYNADIGYPCIIRGHALSFQSCNTDIIIYNTLTSGSLFGIFESTKVISLSQDLAIVYTDPVAGDFTISGGLNITYNPTTTTDVSTLIAQASSMGVIYGGYISEVYGLTISISSGFGYYHLNGPSFSQGTLHRYNWETTSLMLPPNETNYVYWNSSEILSIDATLPSTSENILLGRIRTTLENIEFIEKTPFRAEHWPNKTSELFRQGFGAIYSSGSIVTENITPLHINISNGNYYLGSNEFHPSGGDNITFSSYYKNGLGGHIITFTNSVDSSNYGGTNSLIGLSPSYYAKHSLYVVGDDGDEKYFLVYAQDQYPLLLDAQESDIPTPPSYFVEGVALIAGIIVQEGYPNIVEIRDQRPVIGFRASGINASADHSSLLNLSSDDHTQYLLTNGGRSMNGNLNMNGNSIVDISLINDINISTHSSRHLPNGLDPLTTGTPSSIGVSNLHGFANSFARQDHIHAHGNLLGGLLHATASGLTAGFMSSSDKLKLDLILPTKGASTGLISGGVLSFGISASCFSISNGYGQIVTNTGNTQSLTSVSWSGLTNISLTYLSTNLVTYIGITSTASIIQQITPLTREQRRTSISLGAVLHSDNTSVTGFNNLQNIIINSTNQLIDLSESIGYLNISGNNFTFNGSNLKLNKSVGSIYKEGSNWSNNQLDPNVTELSSLTSLSFYYRLQNGNNVGSTITNINPNIYDISGITSSVPTGKWTVQRIYSLIDNSVIIQLGQFIYNSLADAKTSISSESYITDSSLESNGLLRGFLIIQQGTTNLTNNSLIINADKIPSVSGIGIPNVIDIQSTISSTTPINYIGGTVSIQQSTSTQSGYLSFIDWNLFNNKGQTGPSGPQGSTGPSGPQGPAGPTNTNLLRMISISTTDGATVSGTTSNTASKSILIPANSITVGDMPNIQAVFLFTGSNGSRTVRMYINTSETISGAILIGTNGAVTNTMSYTSMGKLLIIKSTTNTIVANVSSNSTTTEGSFSNAASSLNIDWTVDQYLILSMQLNALDSGNVSAVKIWK